MSITDLGARFAVFTLALTTLLALLATSSPAARPSGPGNSAKPATSVCLKHPRRQSSRKGCMGHIRLLSARRGSDTTAPTVSWKAPTVGSTVGGTISGSACEASAGDNRGVTSVVFKVDGSTLNTESDAPWNCRFDSTKVVDGSHVLTATAYDAAGNSRSASLSVTVSNTAVPPPTPEPSPTPPADTTAPTVAWNAPSAGATVKGTIQSSACEVTAADSSGIDRVVFKVDEKSLNTESDAPWNCKLDSTTVTDGSHTLTATAYDPAGNARSVSTDVTVANTVSVPPPAPSPAPEPSGSMIVGLDAGNYGTTGASDVRGAVNTVRFDTERGLSALDAYKKAGLRVQLNFPGPYNSGGVCALNPTTWAANTLNYYKANTTPAQSPVIEALNEPGGTWFWGSNATSSANAACYRNLLKETYAAFHGHYGSTAPKILGTLDGPGGLTFGQRWLTADWATYVDGFVVHPYGGTGSRSSSALGNRALVEGARAMTGGPIYVTEVGWPTAIGQASTGDSLQWSETEQAANLTNFIAWCSGTGYVAEVIYFNYRDFGTNSWYGVLRTDRSRKPAYEALREAALKYGG
ncbi:MAG TPA: Ig-like domain-containing protein [Solirubrobacterales bacterium]|nr:Ig-like domain-containing protein [Solirubrobacterales bacterium]